jgi:subtilase family serine protease
MRHAYQTDSLISAGYDGTGQTIVIIDAFQSPTIVSDLATFNAFYGLPPAQLTQIAPFGMVPFNPSDPNMNGWAGEITLDVEWAHAIAPGAKIVLVLARTNNDADIQNALQYAVDHNLGDVISMSFGENESCMDPAILSAQHDTFAAATLKGITLFASAGDDGAGQANCDGTALVEAASTPASDPLVSGVGGTELHAARYCLTALGCNPAANPSPGTWQSEIVWNELATGFGATGGGFSVIFDEPPYQKSTLPPAGKQRGVPDVAYNAAVLHGVLTYWSDTSDPVNGAGFYLFGGTSAGSPQWAAITAITDQVAGKRLGYLNSAFYQIGRVNKAYPASFHDITSGDNSVSPDVPGFDAETGWDATTGLGSPADTSLASYLIRYVSPGDAAAAVATTKPKPGGKPVTPGHVAPH